MSEEKALSIYNLLYKLIESVRLSDQRVRERVISRIEHEEEIKTLLNEYSQILKDV